MNEHDRAVAFCAAEFPRLVRGLTLYVGSQALAEELAQEALLRACSRWEHVEQLDRPGAWCRRVAINLANSQLRRRHLERRIRHRFVEPDGYTDPDTATAIDVQQAVAALPSRQRTVVVLRLVYDLSVQDAAAEMGVSADAVKSLTRRAVSTLRAELSDAMPAVGRQEVNDV